MQEKNFNKKALKITSEGPNMCVYDILCVCRDELDKLNCEAGV